MFEEYDYLIKIIKSFHQYRIVYLLHLSIIPLLNFVDICYTEGWIAK